MLVSASMQRSGGATPVACPARVHALDWQNAGKLHLFHMQCGLIITTHNPRLYSSLHRFQMHPNDHHVKNMHLALAVFSQGVQGREPTALKSQLKDAALQASHCATKPSCATQTHRAGQHRP